MESLKYAVKQTCASISHCKYELLVNECTIHEVGSICTVNVNDTIHAIQWGKCHCNQLLKGLGFILIMKVGFDVYGKEDGLMVSFIARDYRNLVFSPDIINSSGSSWM
ncbi:uncharacterized protein LOC119995881 [Tripterygium wilfordii]|uniref:uncharacterized protein LOC119995881 n=1 Tax=Tripterygium wilfordii TaxID=458696 RepID=UPI0018F83CDE|nr:uncharacterized protein LOC119995881 [Tripterygium wilfordii]XP_038698276.1 uncharacterized protein LOC119995881 [Tripterygium wilfordii]